MTFNIFAGLPTQSDAIRVLGFLAFIAGLVLLESGAGFIAVSLTKRIGGVKKIVLLTFLGVIFVGATFVFVKLLGGIIYYIKA